MFISIIYYSKLIITRHVIAQKRANIYFDLILIEIIARHFKKLK